MINVQSPLLEVASPSRTVICKKQKILCSVQVSGCVYQLITALALTWGDEAFRAFSNPSFILASSLAGVRKVLLSLFFIQENEEAGFWGVSASNPGGDRRCQPGGTPLSPLLAVSAPSVKLPCLGCKHLALRWFQQLVSSVKSQISMDISINSSSSLLLRSLSKSSLYTILFWIYLVSRVSCSEK